MEGHCIFAGFRLDLAKIRIVFEGCLKTSREKKLRLTDFRIREIESNW